MAEVEQRKTSGLAVAAMVCGICGLVVPWVGFVLSILGIVFGGIAISQTSKNPNLGGKGMAIAGLVTGIVAIALWVILIAWVGILI